ncbi:hypothetical protein FRC04_008053 [Tulasnella sp. 424]|nr:hypothetical protein FRC04_008053 [Tulasnella sp. 424]KAG8974713.1 hypothetical protein FRC05_006873 [Tulasnella sp. 425]
MDVEAEARGEVPAFLDRVLSPVFLADPLRTTTSTEAMSNDSGYSSDEQVLPDLIPPSENLENEDDVILPSQTSSVLSEDTLRITFNPTGVPNEVDVWIDRRPGCGGTTWPAGRVLSDYLTRRGRDNLAGKHCLELGAGTGLVGIAAAKLGARVVVTDQGPFVPIMETNVRLNGVDNEVQALELNWGEPLPPNLGPVDIILAADCVYFVEAYSLLIQTLCDLGDAYPNAEFLFCYRRRKKSDKRLFPSLLRKHFNWKEVADDPNRSIYSRKDVCLLHLTRRKEGNTGKKTR